MTDLSSARPAAAGTGAGPSSSSSTWPAVLSAAGLPPLSSGPRRIASLWSGYGEVLEMRAGNHQLVAKKVAPPRAPSRGGDVGHSRKLRSYEVEAAFYRHYAPLMREDAARGGPAELCPIARPYLIQAAGDENQGGGGSGGGSGGGGSSTTALLLLEDLRPEFPRQPRGYGAEEAKLALEWLAAFHATWFERPPPASAVAEDKERRQRRRGGGGGGAGDASSEPDDADPLVPPLLWGSGCYWHLSTRLEELDAIDGGELPKALAAAASQVDDALRGFGEGRLRYRTLAHGDAKAANFVFGPPGRDGAVVASYDFQYVGGGYGPRDVAYLLCSSVDERVLTAPGGEDALLDHYRDALLAGLKKRDDGGGGSGKSDDPYPREALVRHFELSLVDLCRFMAGWGWWGASRWAQRRAKEVLARLPELLEAERKAVMSGGGGGGE